MDGSWFIAPPTAGVTGCIAGAGGTVTGVGTGAGAMAGAMAGGGTTAGVAGRTGAIVRGAAGAGEPGAGSVPVAGAGSAGSSRSTLRAPCGVPREAVRRPTDCRTRSLSSLAPTAKARGGLPSTAIRARP